MPPAEDPPAFAAVPWLPPFRLGPRMLTDGVLEATLDPRAQRPFARLAFDAATLRFRAEGGAPPEEPPAALRAALAALPEDDLSRAARHRRWAFGAALAAAEAGAAMAALGSLDAWAAAAAARRAWYLRALDAGRPPSAVELAAACREVPQALRLLGNALPTAEAVALLAPLGRLCEVGAGPGLFARALERAGMAVAASDLATGQGTGLAFPVRRGTDAAATLDFFAARGGIPPLLLLWPQPEEGDWFEAVFARVPPGGLIAMASPEYEFAALGGVAAADVPPGAGWLALEALSARLARDFAAAGTAPVVAAGWPQAATPLRLWRRR